jgi:hypothetical protein
MNTSYWAKRFNGARRVDVANIDTDSLLSSDLKTP